MSKITMSGKGKVEEITRILSDEIQGSAMSYDYILFDLDGTLTDPGVGLTKAVEYALSKFNIEVENLSDLYKFIGPPLWDSFQDFYGFSVEDSKKAVEYYREYYGVKGIYENEVYKGIEDLLKSLKNKGKTLIVATSKPEVYAKIVLEHFNLDKYFDFIAGSNFDGTRVKKDEVIQYAVDSCKISDLSKAIMIGDRMHDINGAKKVGLDSIGVLYGYGDRVELESAGAKYIAETVEDIEELLIDDIEMKLDEADRIAEETSIRYSSDEVFGRIRETKT